MDVAEWSRLLRERRELETLIQGCDMVHDGLYDNYNRIIAIDPWLDAKLNALNEIRGYLKRCDDEVDKAMFALK